jgi:hypothetical protein
MLSSAYEQRPQRQFINRSFCVPVFVSAGWKCLQTRRATSTTIREISWQARGLPADRPSPSRLIHWFPDHALLTVILRSYCTLIAMDDSVVFRPSKRRKFIRQHSSGTEDNEVSPQVDSPAAQLDHEATAEDSSVSSILKLRRQQKPRGGGVQFSNSRSAAIEDIAGSTALVLAETPADTLKGIADRFVGHSAQVVDVDKHMCVPPLPGWDYSVRRHSY